MRCRLNGDPICRENPYAPWKDEDVYPEVLSYHLDLAGFGELPDDPVIDEWLESFWWSRWPVLFLIERCCHDGEVLTLDLRETRMMGFPIDAIAACEHALATVPADYEQELFFIVSWAVRFERGSRMPPFVKATSLRHHLHR